MLRSAICDNTKEHCFALAALIEQELRGKRVEVECFPSSEELLRHIRSGIYKPDIAFLGVELWDGDGIALAEKLNELIPSCRIVFLSDSLRPASEVYRAEHVWFILRSELPRFIGPALERAMSTTDLGRGRGIMVKGRGRATQSLRRMLVISAPQHTAPKMHTPRSRLSAMSMKTSASRKKTMPFSPRKVITRISGVSTVPALSPRTCRMFRKKWS